MKKKLSALLMSAIMVLSLATNVAAQYEVTALDVGKEVHIHGGYCNHEAFIGVPEEDVPITTNFDLSCLFGHQWAQWFTELDYYYSDATTCNNRLVKQYRNCQRTSCSGYEEAIAKIPGGAHIWQLDPPNINDNPRYNRCRTCGWVK